MCKGLFEFEDSNNAGIGNRQEYDRNARAKQRILKHGISTNLGVWFTRIGRSQDAKKHGEIKSNHKKMYGYNAIMLLSLSLVLDE